MNRILIGALALLSFSANAQTLSGTSGGGGLFKQNLSAAPSSTSTGLTTWLNQGANATFTNNKNGLTITDNNNGASNSALRCLTKAVPATPYTINALIALDGISSGATMAGIGWYDGSAALHTIEIEGQGNPFLISVRRWTNATTASTSDASVVAGVAIAWFQLKDDGTTVTFSYSASGDPITIYSVAKSSGFLGATGYKNICFFVNAQNSSGTPATTAATLLSYGN